MQATLGPTGCCRAKPGRSGSGVLDQRGDLYQVAGQRSRASAAVSFTDTSTARVGTSMCTSDFPRTYGLPRIRRWCGGPWLPVVNDRRAGRRGDGGVGVDCGGHIFAPFQKESTAIAHR